MRSRSELRGGGKRTRGGLIPTRRPPEPRLAEAEYERFANAVSAAWRTRALDWADDPMSPSRDEITTYWRGLLETFGLVRMLNRVSATIDRSNSSYFRSLFKMQPPRADHAPMRDQWVQINRRLWLDLGGELADRLLEVLRAPRLDADRSVTRAVNAARRANVGLVSGPDVRQTLELGRLLKAGQEQGVRHETLIEQVEQVTGFGKARSRLIARDQAVKHNSAVQLAQGKAAGLTKYRWRITRDEATRPMHRALEGKIFTVGQPPVTNKNGDRNEPGEDYQCRCQREWVIDLFAGLGDS